MLMLSLFISFRELTVVSSCIYFFPLSSEGGIRGLMVLFPDHCLYLYFLEVFFVHFLTYETEFVLFIAVLENSALPMG